MNGDPATQPTAQPGVLPPGGRGLPGGVAVLALLVATLMAAAFFVTQRPLFSLAIPLVAAGALVCAFRPAFAIFGLLVLTGFAGTLTTYLPFIPPRGLTDGGLLCIWVGVAYIYIARPPTRRQLWLMPGVIGIGAYVVLTALEVFTAESFNLGFLSFRGAAWHLSALLLVGLAPWPPGTIRRIAKAGIIVCVAVGGFAIFRKLTGASFDEILTARTVGSTGLPLSTELKFFGSFLNGFELAAWTATALPFLLGLSLGWQGRWRYAAIAGLASCGFALAAADVRTAAIAAAAGLAVTFLLYLGSQGFRDRPRLGIGVIAGLTILVAAVGIYSFTIAPNEESRERFERILTPGDDPAYQARLYRWDQALEELDGYPLGHGLGTVGPIAITEREFGPVGPPILDSSYLKIAIEQGFPVLLLFVISVLLLVGGLGLRTLGTTDPGRAALGCAGTGSLVALLVLFYGGIYIEGPVGLMGWIFAGAAVAQFSFGPAPAGARAAAGHSTAPGSHHPEPQAAR